MRVVRGETDLLDRIEVVVDPDAEPADWDQALAVFLLKFVRNQTTRAGGTAEPAGVDHNWLPQNRERI